MKKQNLFIALAIVACVVIINQDAVAGQDFSLATVETQSAQATGTITRILKGAVSIIGLLGAAVSGYNVFAKGQNSWQYISAFIISIAILGIGMTMFGN